MKAIFWHSQSIILGKLDTFESITVETRSVGRHRITQFTDTVSNDTVLPGNPHHTSYTHWFVSFGSGSTNFRGGFRSLGIIVVTEESPNTDLAQMRNWRMAFGDPRSTLSHLLPRAMLVDVGLDVNDLKRHTFLGSHDNVVMGLLMGGYDAGGIAEEVYAEYRERGIRELTRSKPLSTHMFIATVRLSETDERLVEELLHGLSNDPVGRRVIEAIGPPVTGFVPATESDYEGVREIFRTLRAAGVEP